MKAGPGRALVGGGGVTPPTYNDKVLSYDPILYYPMSELAGAAAINYGSLGAAANGVYAGVTLADALGPDGVSMAPFFDGANDYLNAKTAALEAAWDAGGAEWTIAAWVKVFNAGVWTDASRDMVFNALDAVANWCYIDKANFIAPRMHWYYTGGGVNHSHNNAPGANVNWALVAMTRSEIAGEIRYFWDGAFEANDAVIGAWASVAPFTNIAIGANDTIPTNVWHGWLSDFMMFNRALSDANIADLAITAV